MRIVGTGAAALLVAAAPALPQTPLGLDELAHGVREEDQLLPVMACDGDAHCLLTVTIPYPEEEGIWERRYGRTIDPEGRTVADDVLHVNQGGFWQVFGRDDGFTLLWSQNQPPGVIGYLADHAMPVAQELDHELRTVGPEIEIPLRLGGVDPLYFYVVSASANDGGYPLLVGGLDLPASVEGCAECEIGLFLALFDSSGAAVGHPVSVASDPLGVEQATDRSLAVDSAGNLVVAFSERPQVHLDADVFVRRFSPQGDPLGEEVRVNEYLPGDQWIAAVAASPAGGFLVVWQSELQDGDYEEIYGRLFRPDGEPAGPEFRINTVTRSAQRYPYVAADRHGNYAVAWSSFWDIEFWDTKLRLFRSDGTPINDEIRVNDSRWSSGGGNLAFAPNDTLLVGFSHWTFDSTTLHDAHYRRFAVAPGSEICRVHDGVWDCQFGEGRRDTVRVGFPPREGETPLLGDVDGDGRDDPCWFGGRSLRCDLDHAGRPAELAVRLGGRTAGVPVLADLDGDGRDELCVNRGRSLYCARARDGERLRFRGRVGLPAAPAVVGDLDGDGRDDLCAFAGGRFHCDTAPLGGDDLVIPFGRRHDLPLLVDADGDGRDDPCVRRGSQLLCDLGHDGGEADWQVTLRGRRDWFLAGKLDGL
jgi:hypothetical protein